VNEQDIEAALTLRIAHGATQPPQGEAWGAPRGAVNAWKCSTCGALLVAIHVDQGVTPLMLRCRGGKPGCVGEMISAGYPPEYVPPRIMERLAWEWHTISRTQMKALRRSGDRATFEHVSQGGLLLRELTDAGRGAAIELPSPLRPPPHPSNIAATTEEP